jgi:hypothetical protein
MGVSATTGVSGRGVESAAAAWRLAVGCHVDGWAATVEANCG